MTRIAAIALGFALTTSAYAQHDMPAGMSHEEHIALMKQQAEMKQRGNAAMGFDQDKTIHHFLLTAKGGIIQVETKDASDSASRSQIRTHLKSISQQFAHGDFSAPVQTHNEMPPGAATMKRLAGAITYSLRELPNGAEVQIRSDDANAIKAIHQFLQYQIKEHATGDPTTPK